MVQKEEIESQAETGLPLTSQVLLSDPNPAALSANQIHGGNTGAFSREQLPFIGFDKIKADITLPYVSGIEPDPNEDEQPWVYFGFDDEDYTHGIEGGFAYQHGDDNKPQRWLPFVRYGSSSYSYDHNTEYYDGDIAELRVHINDASQDNVLVIVERRSVILSATMNFDNYETLSVKRVTSIAKNNFNGSALHGSTVDCGFDNLKVSTIFDPFLDFYDYDLYHYWSGTKWYGTIDWPASMIERYREDRHLRFVSIND
ncbi:MAG: hypothetical protein ACOYI6_11645 [Christensenellales bacterium]|jgi:hypothetical protein